MTENNDLGAAQVSTIDWLELAMWAALTMMICAGALVLIR